MFGATPRGEVTLDEQGLCFAGIIVWSVSGAAPVRGVVTLEDSRHICSGSEAVWSRVIIWSTGGYHACICVGALCSYMSTCSLGKNASDSVCGGSRSLWSSSSGIKAHLALSASFPVSCRFCISENLSREVFDFLKNSELVFAKFDFLVGAICIVIQDRYVTFQSVVSTCFSGWVYFLHNCGFRILSFSYQWLSRNQPGISEEFIAIFDAWLQERETRVAVDG